MDINKLKQISLTYARAAGAAVIAMYMAGETDPKKLAYAFVAGFVGPVAKYFDKSAKDFGLTKQAKPTENPSFQQRYQSGGFFLFLPTRRVESSSIEFDRWSIVYSTQYATAGLARVLTLWV